MYTSVDALLESLASGASWHRTPMDKHTDSLSGSSFERATIGDQPYVIKYIGRDLDWLMRVLGDGEGGREPWALLVWRTGLLDALPPEIDPVIVGMAYDPDAGLLAQVMRDIGVSLVPASSAAVPLAQHGRFLDHMAALHATFWGFTDRYGLIRPAQRYGFAHPRHADHEPDAIPRMFPGGWAAVRSLAPAAADVALALIDDPTPLVRALAGTPSTFVHGDWKFGNLGSLPDGRTVLLDWAWPGETGPAVDLAWYLAVNCDRLPESKEDTIQRYATALAARGIDLTGWWDRQLELALLGAFLQLGWSKPGNPAELAWWTERAVATAATL